MGIDHVKIDGVVLSTRTDRWARLRDGKSTEDGKAALIAAGYAEHVRETYNSNQVSALLREYENEGRPLPDVLADVFELNPTTKVVATANTPRR